MMDFEKDPPYESFASAHTMIGLLQTGSIQEAKELRKNYILDSFTVSNFHTTYKDWINSKNGEIINNLAPKYNELNTKIARSNEVVTKLSQKHQRARERASFPVITISRSTVELLGIFKELLSKTPPNKISFKLDDLFIVGKGDIRDGKLDLDFETVEKLIQIEFRIRMERRVQLAVLNAARTLLAAKSKKWTGRTMQLDDFMRKFVELTLEVDRIRQNEKEDLDYYSDEMEEEVEDMEEMDGEDTKEDKEIDVDKEVEDDKEIDEEKEIDEDGGIEAPIDDQEKEINGKIENEEPESRPEEDGQEGIIDESMNNQKNDESTTDGEVEEPQHPRDAEAEAAIDLDLEDELMNVDG